MFVLSYASRNDIEFAISGTVCTVINVTEPMHVLGYFMKVYEGAK